MASTLQSGSKHSLSRFRRAMTLKASTRPPVVPRRARVRPLKVLGTYVSCVRANGPLAKGLGTLWPNHYEMSFYCGDMRPLCVWGTRSTVSFGYTCEDSKHGMLASLLLTGSWTTRELRDETVCLPVCRATTSELTRGLWVKSPSVLHLTKTRSGPARRVRTEGDGQTSGRPAPVMR